MMMVHIIVFDKNKYRQTQYILGPLDTDLK